MLNKNFKAILFDLDGTLVNSQADIARSVNFTLNQLGRGALPGEEVARFEAEFAAFCLARHCIGVGNGTEALQIALRLSGIRPGQGQQVVTTPWTASFTAHAIVAAGGRPEASPRVHPVSVRWTPRPRTVLRSLIDEYFKADAEILLA